MNSIILNEKKLEIEDLKLAAELSLAKTKLDKYIILLKKDYGYRWLKKDYGEMEASYTKKEPYFFGPKKIYNMYIVYFPRDYK